MPNSNNIYKYLIKFSDWYEILEHFQFWVYLIYGLYLNY